ncbi:MAG: SWF/SNF helicase family protein [Pontiellaceae bacterium]|nr:SWF/SNF helicase family protein [Pontiellaceae bacterium]
MSDAEISEYEHIRQQVADEYGQSATLISLLRLRQFCTHPALLGLDSDISLLSSSKYCRLLEILEEIVSRCEKVIVFTSFTAMSDFLCEDMPGRFNIPAWQIDGRTPVGDRQRVVDRFSEVEGSAVLVLNPRAAGTGLNITAANHVIHYTLEWNPAVEDQATARSYRRGQTLPVTVHRLFYPDTVEDVINDRLGRKRLLAETAVVGTEASAVEAADVARALQLSPCGNSGGDC